MIFLVDQKDHADQLIREYHYSQRPVNSIYTFTWHRPRTSVFFDGELVGKAEAASVFSTPPTRWSETVLELLRLVRTEEDDLPPLTSFLSECVSYIKRDGKFDLLISFADSTQDHHGGIYQAASWNYHGKRNRAMDGLIIDGEFVPGRTCNFRYGTRSPVKLAKLRPLLDVQPHYDEGKHLYWKPLNRRGKRKASILELEQNEYPKPEKI